MGGKSAALRTCGFVAACVALASAAPAFAIVSRRAPRSWMRLRASDTNATGSTGFPKNAEAPRLSASRCSSFSLCPVIITIGV